MVAAGVRHRRQRPPSARVRRLQPRLCGVRGECAHRATSSGGSRPRCSRPTTMLEPGPRSRRPAPTALPTAWSTWPARTAHLCAQSPHRAEIWEFSNTKTGFPPASAGSPGRPRSSSTIASTSAMATASFPLDAVTGSMVWRTTIRPTSAGAVELERQPQRGDLLAGADRVRARPVAGSCSIGDMCGKVRVAIPAATRSSAMRPAASSTARQRSPTGTSTSPARRVPVRVRTGRRDRPQARYDHQLAGRRRHRAEHDHHQHLRDGDGQLQRRCRERRGEEQGHGAVVECRDVELEQDLPGGGRRAQQPGGGQHQLVDPASLRRWTAADS